MRSVRVEAPILLALALTFCNFLSTSAARMVLTLYALELGAPASAVGILGGLLFLFPLLLSWPIGAAADRIGARPLLLFGSVCGALSLVLPFFVRSLPMFYLAAALNGLALAFFHVTLQYVIGVMSKSEERARNFSNFSLAGALTNFVGPVIAGLAIDTLGHALACLITALGSAIATVLMIVWGRLFPPGKPAAAKEFGPAPRLIDRDVVRMLIVSGMVQLGYDLFQFFLPIYGHSIGLSASAIGSTVATLATAAFVVRLLLARLVKRYSGKTLLTAVFVMGALGFALVPIATNAFVLSVIAFVFGLGMGIGIPLTVILMFSSSAEGRSGQTLGVRLTVNNLVRVTGPIAFGAIGAALGLAAVFWIVAIVLGAGAVLARGWVDKA